MKFPFFGKNDDSDGNESKASTNEIVLVGANEPSIAIEDEPLDISSYNHESFSSKATDGAAFLDSIIPLVPAVADGAAQYGHAVVRFPKDAGWKDLLNRKTPGWEDYKQLGILKDGKFQPQAAIKQAKLQPAAVANIALQGAAIAVGQAYMTEINNQLENIEAGIEAIQREMEIEREARIQADFDMLQEYMKRYASNAESPEKMNAVLGNIESIKTDTREAWAFQMRMLNELNKKVTSSKKMKDAEVRASLNEFVRREHESLAAFQLMMAAEQVSMQYDGDFSTMRIEHEKELLLRYLSDFNDLRGSTCSALSGKIDLLKGDLLVIPEAIEDEYQPQNLLFDAAHEIGKQVPRINPAKMREEAKGQLADKKKRYQRAVSTENRVSAAGVSYAEDLDRLDFAYNQANSMIIDKGSIHFLSIESDEPRENDKTV